MGHQENRPILVDVALGIGAPLNRVAASSAVRTVLLHHAQKGVSEKYVVQRREVHDAVGPFLCDLVNLVLVNLVLVNLVLVNLLIVPDTRCEDIFRHVRVHVLGKLTLDLCLARAHAVQSGIAHCYADHVSVRLLRMRKRHTP